MANNSSFALLSCALLVFSSVLVTAIPAPQQPFEGSLNEDWTAWHKFVRAPSSKVVLPAQVLSQYTAGDVENPDGLIAQSGPTVLTRKGQDDDIPSIVVDFGQNYAGILSIDFDGAEAFSNSENSSGGLPGITLAFSETLEGLTDRSDFTRSDNADGVSALVRTYSNR